MNEKELRHQTLEQYFGERKVYFYSHDKPAAIVGADITTPEELSNDDLIARIDNTKFKYKSKGVHNEMFYWTFYVLDEKYTEGSVMVLAYDSKSKHAMAIIDPPKSINEQNLSWHLDIESSFMNFVNYAEKLSVPKPDYNIPEELIHF